MILVDVNLLVYAHNRAATQHQAARAWLNQTLNGEARVGLPWHSLLGFIRLSTNPRVVLNPPPVAELWKTIVEILNRKVVWIPQPTERHVDILGGLLVQNRAAGNLVADAHLAALAIEHGLTLCSTDGDFARFKTLRWVNPLAPA